MNRIVRPQRPWGLKCAVADSAWGRMGGETDGKADALDAHVRFFFCESLATDVEKWAPAPDSLQKRNKVGAKRKEQTL